MPEPNTIIFLSVLLIPLLGIIVAIIFTLRRLIKNALRLRDGKFTVD